MPATTPKRSNKTAATKVSMNAMSTSSLASSSPSEGWPMCSWDRDTGYVATLSTTIATTATLRVWDSAAASTTTTTALLSACSIPEHVGSVTAMTWTSCPCIGGAGKKNAGKKTNSPATKKKWTTFLVLATSTGHVLVYSVATGALSPKAIQVHAGSIVDVAAAQHHLFFCTSDGAVSEWEFSSLTTTNGDSLQESKLIRTVQPANAGIAPAKVSVDTDRIYLASSGLSVLDRETGGKLFAYAAHASPISCIAMAKDRSFILTGTQQDRFLHVSMRNGKRVSNLTMDANCRSVDVSTHSSPFVLALNENREVCLWKAAAMTAGGPPQCVISLSSGELLSALFDGDGSHVILVYGSWLSPSFERIRILKEDGDLIESVSLVRNVKAHVSATIKAQQGSMEMMNKPGFTVETTAIDTSKLVMTDEEKAKRAEEPTLQEKLESLAMSNPKTPKKASQPTTTSLHSMLTQAVHSGDMDLLEKSLEVRNPEKITATVSRMHMTTVVPFLNMLVTRITRTPSRAYFLVDWIRATLICHAPYLMSIPSIVTQLGPLYKLMEARTTNMVPLSKLSARLDCVVHRMGDVAPQERMDQEAQFEYTEIPSDEEDWISSDDLDEDEDVDEDMDEEGSFADSGDEVGFSDESD